MDDSEIRNITSTQVSTVLFDNKMTTGPAKMFFLIPDLNISCFFWQSSLETVLPTLPIKVFLSSSALTSSLASQIPHFRTQHTQAVGMSSSRGSGIQPATASLGGCVLRRGLEADARKMPPPLPGSSWQAHLCTPPFPFSSLSEADG